jgi:hypothetical protein
MMGYVTRMGQIKNAYKILLGKLKGRHRLRLEHNIKTYFKEVGSGGVDWIHISGSGWGAVASSCEYSNETVAS